jgi:hypothetical protein
VKKANWSQISESGDKLDGTAAMRKKKKRTVVGLEGSGTTAILEKYLALINRKGNRRDTDLEITAKDSKTPNGVTRAAPGRSRDPARSASTGGLRASTRRVRPDTVSERSPRGASGSRVTERSCASSGRLLRSGERCHERDARPSGRP